MSEIHIKIISKYIISLFFFLLLYLRGVGSTSGELSGFVGSELVRSGFENVRLSITGEKVIVAFENRRFRSDARAIVEVIWIIRKYLEKGTVTLVVELRRLPVLMVEVDLYSFDAFEKGLVSKAELYSTIRTSNDVDAIWKNLKQIEIQNYSSFKTEVLVNPDFRAQFGDYSDPLQSQVNLIPEVVMHTWQGASFSGQVVVPLQNDLSDEGNLVRPGILSINQLLRIPDQVLVSLAVGAFSNNRIGLDADLKKYLLNGQLAFGARIGITDYVDFTGYQANLEDEILMQALLNVQYFNPVYDVSVRLTGGMFLYQDIGLRFDISRYFGEASIGFFALRTNGELNGGFNFSIPLPPGKHTKLRSVRLRPADSFYWGYRVKGFPQEGIIYSTGQSIDGMMNELNPSYVRNQMVWFIQNKLSKQ